MKVTFGSYPKLLIKDQDKLLFWLNVANVKALTNEKMRFKTWEKSVLLNRNRNYRVQLLPTSKNYLLLCIFYFSVWLWSRSRLWLWELKSRAGEVCRKDGVKERPNLCQNIFGHRVRSPSLTRDFTVQYTQ